MICNYRLLGILTVINVFWLPGSLQSQVVDTVYYYEPANLQMDSTCDYVLGSPPALYVQKNPLWGTYSLVEIQFQMPYDTLYFTSLPYQVRLGIYTSVPDTTQPHPNGQKNLLGVIPGVIIDTVAFTYSDTDDFYPNWYKLDLRHKLNFQNLSGDFWIFDYLLYCTGFDTVPPFSGHALENEFGWWYQVQYDWGIKFILELTSLDVEEAVPLPAAFNLTQNYPNPFNASTSIKFNIAEYAAIRLNVFDIRGRFVAALFERYTAPGPYSVSWNGNHQSGHPMPSGLYFAVMEALNGTGQSEQIIKMLLLK